MKVPVFVVLAFQGLHRVGGTVHRKARAAPQQFGQGARMVHLAVVLHDGVQLVENPLGLQVVHELLGEGEPDRIHEDGFLLLDNIGVVTRALVGRVFLAVELLEFPVDLANPIHVAFQMFFHGFSSFAVFLPPGVLRER
jgi:hypothetical protein